MDLDTVRKFLADHSRSVLATTRRDGRPQMSPVVHAIDDAGRVMIFDPGAGLQGDQHRPRSPGIAVRVARRVLR